MKAYILGLTETLVDTHIQTEREREKPNNGYGRKPMKRLINSFSMFSFEDGK